ncbi:NPCBM/NEW2 domain-containing protein [Verrucomicrobiaceae bacterium N1E253]|uniref:NPCBM/NEW2 domain-containing protein n=1 Tax=Oceaniferula marina TaxID=2748318 RepID=A0A851GDE3_9BACT|nr:NPCBM/NEW2 domain-containing protein [Oceaniferula marina]NWK55778.1 NPCBM/NEW2 domain-containing protein [Oceaniferula marina]
MRTFYLAILASALCYPPPSAAAAPSSPNEEAAQKSAKALKIIKAWRGDAQANPSDARTLHVVYWTPSDHPAAPAYRERLSRTMFHIRDFYAREMKRLGFGPLSINLDTEKDELLKIHMVTGLKPYADYKPSDGQRILKECVPSLEKAGITENKETILIFCNLSKWDAEKMLIVQDSPYYARGTHCEGCAWQVDSPILDPNDLDKKQPMLRDRQYGRISLGRYNSIFVGGVCHELGHALGLPHNRERQDERSAHGTALMGSGNRTYGEELRGEGKGSFLTLANGLRLATHPMFSGVTREMWSKGKATLTDIDIQAGDRLLKVSGKVKHAEGTPPVYAVLAYCDPAGRSNYDATTATAIPDAEGNFTLHCTDLQAGKSASLRLIALYANGDATSHIGSRTPYAFPYLVDKNGQANLDTWNLLREFLPLQSAIQRRNQKDIHKELTLLSKSQQPKASAIAKRMLARGHPHPSPEKIEAEVQAVALADTTPASAKVGYFRPTYNRLPRPDAILQSESQIFTSGIYAHAPAKHSYQLGGKWKTLSGQCGIAQGNSGSCVFVIKADGKTLWRSKTVKSGRLQGFKIDVSGKQNLELIVEDAGDGNGSDWGLWLEPQLKR